jgi:hypothetical protein
VTGPGAGTPVAATSTDAGPGQSWRSARGPLVVALVVVLGALVLALVAGGRPAGRLDPRSPTPSGSRAVAEVLRDQGVTVDLATTTAAVRRLADPGTTVLVTDPELLADSQAAAVRDSGADLVVVEALRPERFARTVSAGSASPPEVRRPGCRLAPASRAGSADAGAGGYRVDAGADSGGTRLCYARDGEASLVRVRDGNRTVTLLASGVALTNRRFGEEGNASLALGLLGGHDRLVWYLPSLSDVPATDAQESVYDLVPDGVWWGLVQLGVAVVLLALWRARRLGPVVPEPLPVVVQAAETVEGRARLYRRSRARDTAAESLRGARRVRLGRLLGLPARSAPTALVDAAAARAGRDPGAVAGLLYGAAPADDAALVRLADDLDALDREVRRP